jgi:hypothetical protein
MRMVLDVKPILLENANQFIDFSANENGFGSKTNP